MLYLNLTIMVLCALLHGLPWLFDSWIGMVMSWCGMACGMWLATLPGPWNRWWCLWIWASVSIGIAFHWSADAMTYTLSSDYWLGCLVALPLVLWDGLRLALGYWLGARFCRRPELVWLSTAACTILLEQFMPGVFPWRLGMMQLPWPWWLQAVDVFGAGVSTLLAFAIAGLLLNSVSYLLKARQEPAEQRVSKLENLAGPRWTLAIAPSLLLLNALYCGFSWQACQHAIQTAPTVSMGLVQVDPSMKVSTEQLRELTREIAGDVQLVCWPESTGGTYDLRLEELSNPEKNFQLSRDPERGLRPWPNPSCELLLAGKNYLPYQSIPLTPVKAGRLESDSETGEPERLYVTAMLLDDHEHIIGRYHKRFLMPFGEYVPGEEVVPGMAELFDMSEHVTPGDGCSVLESQTGARIGVMLCYEDMVPKAASSAVVQDANVIVSLINGSAFASPVTLHQHRLLAHMRALESRRSFVRCAATGETCLISACGELVSRLPLQENGAMKCDVPLLEGISIYSQYSHLLIAALIPGLIFAARKS